MKMFDTSNCVIYCVVTILFYGFRRADNKTWCHRLWAYTVKYPIKFTVTKWQQWFP